MILSVVFFSPLKYWLNQKFKVNWKFTIQTHDLNKVFLKMPIVSSNIIFEKLVIVNRQAYDSLRQRHMRGHDTCD